MDTNLSFAATGRLVAQGTQFQSEGKTKGTLTLRDSAGGEPVRILCDDGHYVERVADMINAAGASDMVLSQMTQEALRKRYPLIAPDLMAIGYGTAAAELQPQDMRDLVEHRITAKGCKPEGDGWAVVRSILRGTHRLAAEGDVIVWVRSRPTRAATPRLAAVGGERA